MNFEPSERDPGMIEVGKFLPPPPDVVWRALTEPATLERWLMRPVGFQPSIGTGFVFTVPTRPTAEIACEVLRAGRGHRLTYSWVDLRANRPARWILDWSLHPQGRGTRLLLRHSGFDVDDRMQRMARNALERGWKTALLRLDQVLDSPAQ